MSFPYFENVIVTGWHIQYCTYCFITDNNNFNIVKYIGGLPRTKIPYYTNLQLNIVVKPKNF